MFRQKVGAIIAIICIAIFSFTLTASADTTHYASIPKPESSDYVRYIIADNSTQNYPTIYRISIPEIFDADYVHLFLNCTSDGVLDLVAHNSTGLSFNLVVERFSLSGSFISVYNKNISSDAMDYTTILHFTYPNMAYIDPGNIPITDPDGLYDFAIPSIAWSDATDPDLYLEHILQIERYIMMIQNTATYGTDVLDDVLSELSLLTDLFNANSDIIKSQTDKIDESLSELNEDINEEMSELNQGIDELVTQGQAEYNSAVSGADDSLNVITGIENKGEGIISAMGSLISALSYNGTECNWQLPEVYIPAIPNVIDRTLLFQNAEIDFEFWIDKIPDNIMTVIKALSTLALIIYCFKELYGTLAYVFTLKKE